MEGFGFYAWQASKMCLSFPSLLSCKHYFMSLHKMWFLCPFFFRPSAVYAAIAKDVVGY